MTDVSRLPDRRTYQQGIAEGVRRVHARQHRAVTHAGMVALGITCAVGLAFQFWERVRQ